MAAVWQITDGTNTIDLTTAKGTAGWHGERWHAEQFTDIPGDGSIPEYIMEAIPVVLSAATDDAFGGHLQTFGLLQKEAAEYWVDQQQATPVWYHEKLSAETGERRALVKSLGLALAEETGSLKAGSPSTTAGKKATLFVERHPYWERPIARIFPNATPSAAAAVAYDYTDWGPLKLLNPGFETGGGGGADIWANWTEHEGDGELANENVLVHGGADACKMTAGEAHDSYVYQELTLTSNQIYYFYIYARGDGTNQGRYAIYDQDNSAYIVEITATGVTEAAYTLVSATFTVPATCTAVRVILYCSTIENGICYWDDGQVRLKSHDIVGDVPARVNGLAIRCATAAVTLRRFWMGIRSATRHGATGVTDFLPVWECEDGTFGGDVSEDAATEVNTASPGSGSGSYLQVVENATDWDDGDFHLVVNMNMISAGYAATASDGFGRFIWLLRTKVTAGTWQVRLRAGYSTAQSYYDPAEVSNTSWDYKQVAVCSIPPRNLQAIASDVIVSDAELNFMIYLYAQRTAGAGDLYVDCFCLIPVDEGSLVVPSTYALTTTDTVIGEGPSESAQVVAHIGTINFFNAAFENEDFRLPPGDGRVICTYARLSSSVLTDQIEFADPADVTSIYTERWTALRGAE